MEYDYNLGKPLYPELNPPNFQVQGQQQQSNGGMDRNFDPFASSHQSGYTEAKGPVPLSDNTYQKEMSAPFGGQYLGMPVFLPPQPIQIPQQSQQQQIPQQYQIQQPQFQQEQIPQQYQIQQQPQFQQEQIPQPQIQQQPQILLAPQQYQIPQPTSDGFQQQGPFFYPNQVPLLYYQQGAPPQQILQQQIPQQHQIAQQQQSQQQQQNPQQQNPPQQQQIPQQQPRPVIISQPTGPDRLLLQTSCVALSGNRAIQGNANIFRLQFTFVGKVGAKNILVKIPYGSINDIKLCWGNTSNPSSMRYESNGSKPSMLRIMTSDGTMHSFYGFKGTYLNQVFDKLKELHYSLIKK